MLYNFLVRMLQYLRKNKTFLGHEDIKKLTAKVGYAVWIFFSLCSPDCPKQQRIEYPLYRFLYPMICGTISGAR